MTAIQKRKRTITLRVVVTSDERDTIKQFADATSLSVSGYLRVLGLGYEPKSTIDGDHIREVIRTRGDLGRVGGLLKLWLTERPEEGSPAVDVRRVLEQLEEVMEEVRHKVRKL